MKKFILLIILVITMFCVSACSKKNENALAFKKEYESINGKLNSSGNKHRELSIPKDNPYEKISAKKVLEKIENKDTFYVYFGDKLCPWCRSVIEKSIEVAKNNEIDKIYYVAIWDDEGNEVLRDKLFYDDNKIIKTVNGTEEYYKLLDVFNDLLSDYKLQDAEGKELDTGEKRIYAPNFIYIEEGVPKKLTEGISELQTDPREKLTDKILKDEEKLFTEFFNN